MVNHPNCFISKRKGMKNFSIGIDVSKEKFDLTVKKAHFGAEQSEFLHYDVYENNPSGFRKMLKAVDKATGRADKSEWLFCLETQVLMNCTYVIICMLRGTMCGAKVHYK